MLHYKVNDLFCHCISGIVLVLTWVVHYLFVLNSMLNILAYLLLLPTEASLLWVIRELVHMHHNCMYCNQTCNTITALTNVLLYKMCIAL